MVLVLLAMLAAAAPTYDVFLGMSAKDRQSRQAFLATDPEFTPKIEQQLSLGRDTVVSWTWPVKHNLGIGVQVYGPNGRFVRRLEDSEFPTGQVVVCQDRYVVGGGNTLRVWDARRQYKLVTKKVIPDLEQYHATKCAPNGIEIRDTNSYYGKDRTLRFSLPDLR